MNIKKTIWIFLAAVLIAVLGVVGYLYNRLNRTSDLPSHIPKEADKVYFANSGQIMQLLLSGKLKHGFGAKETIKNAYLKNIPDMKNTGIDFLNGAAFVEYKNIRYVLLPLQDADQLAKTIALIDGQLLNPAEDHDGFRKVFAKRDSFTLVWNKNLLALIPKKYIAVSDAFILDILEVKKENSFSAHSHYSEIKKDDALIWFYDAHTDLRISSPSVLKGYLLYDTCFSGYASNNIIKPYGKDTSYAPVSSAPNFIYADTANAFTNKLMLQLAEIFLPAELSKIKPTQFNQFNKIFLLKGRQVLENRIVSYVYDDDFNKHEIETLQKDTVHKAFMTFVPPGHLWHSTFSSIPGERDTTFRLLTPENLKLMAYFNQDLTQTVFPLDFKYNIQFLYLNEGGFNTYQLRFKIENLKAAVKVGLMD